ncbi:thioredoxin-like protein [Delphinella strobiligena]|nr:thioredoxin-like protein [Delphinella strobiligena]
MPKMCYESQISFTTYLAKRRLDRALAQVNSANPPVKFTIKYLPYQLYPDASQAGEDKYEWYKKSRYGESEEKMNMYTTLMSAYGASEGIKYKFGGTVANTLHAHRLIQHFQEEKGTEVADKIVVSLYRQYFEEEKHPSSEETLLEAAREAGISEQEANTFIKDQSDGMIGVKMLIREQVGNGIDAVPYIMIEGKKRDFTIEGCKEVEDYVKALQQVVKESS